MLIQKSTGLFNKKYQIIVFADYRQKGKCDGL